MTDGEIAAAGGAGTSTETVTIGGVEMQADEVATLIETGKSYKTLTEQYPDINFEELPKSFTQARQELADLKKPKPAEVNADPKEEERKRNIAEFFKDPDVQQHLDEVTSKKEQALREDLEFQKLMETLESEFDGTDGRPKFDKKAVLDHGMKVNIFNPRAAYKDLHEDALETWAVKKANEKRRPTTFLERGGSRGAAMPTPKEEPRTFAEATAAALAESED